jgi:gas vesicle protein
VKRILIGVLIGMIIGSIIAPVVAELPMLTKTRRHFSFIEIDNKPAKRIVFVR